jgi:hypothetical protein
MAASAGRAFSKLVTACLLSLVLSSPASLLAATVEERQNEFKAAALYNLVIFADWPEEGFTSPEAPLVIGVWGEGPVATLLPGLVKGEKWRGRPIALKHYTSPPEAGDCHVLFIARSAQGNWASIRETLPKKYLLTVSDLDQFAANGGGVQISFQNNKLHLSVNLGVTRQAGITLSSRLLRLSEVIGNPRSEWDWTAPVSPGVSIVSLAW